MINYTKGPWKVYPASQQVMTVNPSIKNESGQMNIAEVLLMDTDEACKANASLLAASPELYEALKELVRFEAAIQIGVSALQYPDNLLKALIRAQTLLSKLEQQ